MPTTGHQRLTTAARIALLLLCCNLAHASTARAQAGWTDDIIDLSGVGLHSNPDVGVDAAGNALAVWCTSLGSRHFVEAARYSSADGNWAAATTVYPSAQPCVARVGVAPSGNAVVTWSASVPVSGPVQAAHYTASAGWSPSTQLDNVGHSAQIAIDAVGNAIVVWVTLDHTPAFRVMAARFQVSTSTWATVNISPLRASQPQIAMDESGNATAVWTNEVYQSIQAARYSPDIDAWTTPMDVSEANETGTGPRVAVDGLGNAAVVWERLSSPPMVRAARFLGATATWSRPVSLGAYGPESPPRIAANAAGTFMALWTEEGWDYAISDVYVARYSLVADAWTQAFTNWSYFAYQPDIAIDAAGNALALWGTPQGMRTARGTSSNQWSERILISWVWSFAGFGSIVRIDAGGNTIAVWAEVRGSNSSNRVIRTTRWAATPAAPSITALTSGNASLDVDLTPPPTPEPMFNVTNYEYSLDDGTTWTTRSPASTASRLTISGLTNGVAQPVRVRALNVSGRGSSSARALGMPGLEPPRDFRTLDVSANVVTLGWAPANGVPPAGYVIEGGLTPGAVLGSLTTPGAATTFTFTAPSGVFYLRVRALVGQTRSGASNEIQISVNVPGLPSAPTDLLGLADGSDLTLAWRNTLRGGTATGVELDVSGARSGSLPLPLTERFSFSSVPPGTYTFAVRAINGFGSSVPSNSVTLTFPAHCTPPAPPTNFSVSKSGNTVFVSWSVPASGTPPTSYLLTVSGSLVGSFSTTLLELSGAVGPGVYRLSVQAVNPCGQSPATAPQAITIP